MNDLDVRDALLQVHHATPVPVPDRVAFDDRVRGARRRYAAARLAAASVAAAAVTVGAVVVLGVVTTPDRASTIATPGPSPADPGVPVVVAGRLTTLDDDGSLGEPGPEVSSVVGSSPDGVIVLEVDGVLARVGTDGGLRALSDGPVLRAFLDGAGVVYQGDDGIVRWTATDRPTDSARTDGTLVAAAQDGFVMSDGSGLVAHDADGVHDIVLGSDGAAEVVEQVEIGGDRLAVSTRGGVQFFAARGERLSGALGGADGALSPDGSVWATAPSGDALDRGARPGLQLLDPRDALGVRVPGPRGPALDLWWRDAATLYVVEGGAGSRTLWRCADAGTSCAVVLEDPTDSVRLPAG